VRCVIEFVLLLNFAQGVNDMGNKRNLFLVAIVGLGAFMMAGCPTQPGQDPEFDRALDSGFRRGVALARNNPGSDGSECEQTPRFARGTMFATPEDLAKANKAGCWIGYGAYNYGVGMAENEAPDTTACAEYPPRVNEILRGYYQFRPLTSAETAKVIQACEQGYAEN
jgi:hypothetical protein